MPLSGIAHILKIAGIRFAQIDRQVLAGAVYLAGVGVNVSANIELNLFRQALAGDSKE